MHSTQSSAVSLTLHTACVSCRDKLESEIKKDEKDEKLEGDAALQKLFRDIYGGADEDTRRAMNKSFQVPLSLKPLHPPSSSCFPHSHGCVACVFTVVLPPTGWMPDESSSAEPSCILHIKSA